MTLASITAAPENLAIGESFETALWRVHRGAATLSVTHILFAGKRGKRCARLCLSEWSRELDYKGLCDAAGAVLALVGRDAGVEEVRHAARRIAEDSPALTPHRRTIELHEAELRGVDVDRQGEQVEVNGPKLFARAASTGFLLRCKVDQNNDPSLMDDNRSDPPRVLAWVRANAAAIEAGMTLADAWKALAALDIHPRYFCGRD